MSLDNFHVDTPKDWQAFERLCRDLWAKVLRDPNTQMNGRAGQAQAGVDVYGTDAATHELVGIQCKGKDRGLGAAVTVAELNTEVDKAKKFKPSLRHFVLATTGPADVAVQERARILSQEHAKNGLFDVRVVSWDADIVPMLWTHVDVLADHYRPRLTELRRRLGDVGRKIIAVCHASQQNAGEPLDSWARPLEPAEQFNIDCTATWADGVIDPRHELVTQRQRTAELLACLRAAPVAQLAYYGIAHVPLVMQLGATLGNKREFRHFEKNYTKAGWTEIEPGDGKDIGIALTEEEPRGGDDYVLIVEFSYQIAREHVRAVVAGGRRIWRLGVAEPKPGVFTHEGQLRRAAELFREVLDAVHNERPGATLHVFYTGQVTPAFRMGQMVNRTLHGRTLVYNFSKRQTPHYHWAVDISTQQDANNNLWSATDASI